MKKIFILLFISITSFTLMACGSSSTVETFEVLNRRDNHAVTAYIHNDHWHGSLPNVDEGHSLSLGVRIVDKDKGEITLDSEGAHHGFSVALAEGAQEGIVSFVDHGDHVHIVGEEEGTTQVVFKWLHDGEVVYTTPAINITVTHHEHSHDQGDIGAFEVLNRRADNEKIVYVHGDHWHGSLPNVKVGESLSLGAYIESSDGRVRELDSEGAHNGFTVSLYEGAQEGIVNLVNHGDHVHIHGVSPGITVLVFSWTHDGEVRFTTPPINITVVE